MKKTLSIALASIGVFALLAVFAVSQQARAEQDGNGHESKGIGSAMMNSGDKRGNTVDEFDNQGEWKGAKGLGFGTGQESAIVRPNGNFRVTGATVNSVDASAGTVTATLFGLTKTVSLSGTTITGGGQTITLGDIKAGDKINATGNYNAAGHTATVSRVIDLSYGDKQVTDIQSRIQQLLQLVQQLQTQLRTLQH